MFLSPKGASFSVPEDFKFMHSAAEQKQTKYRYFCSYHNLPNELQLPKLCYGIVSDQVNGPTLWGAGPYVPNVYVIEKLSCLISWPLRHTWQVNGIGVAKLLRSLEELIIGYRREKRDHVVQSVVTNRSQLLRPGIVRGMKPLNPLIKDGISKGVKNLQIDIWARMFIRLFLSSKAFKAIP